jgi:hypothetical protein
MIRFRFDIDKAIAASAYIIQKGGGRFDVFALIKTLYLANRISLVKYGRSITGDKLASLDEGPVVADTYHLIQKNGLSKPGHQAKWNQFISEQQSRVLRLLKAPDFGHLSVREISILDEAFKTISEIPPYWLLSWTREHFPEWKAPKGSSTAIDPVRILKAEKKSKEEIAESIGPGHLLFDLGGVMNRCSLSHLLITPGTANQTIKQAGASRHELNERPLARIQKPDLDKSPPDWPVLIRPRLAAGSWLFRALGCYPHPAIGASHGGFDHRGGSPPAA